MGAPVRNDAVGAVWGITPASISHDRVIWNARRDGKFVYGSHETIVGFQRVHAVRHACECLRGRIGDEKRFHRCVNRGEELRGSDETRTNPTNPACGQITATMGRRNKDYPLNVWPMIKNERFFEDSARV